MTVNGDMKSTSGTFQTSDRHCGIIKLGKAKVWERIIALERDLWAIVIKYIVLVILVALLLPALLLNEQEPTSMSFRQIKRL